MLNIKKFLIPPPFTKGKTMQIHHIAPKDKSLWHPLWNKCYNSWKQAFKNNSSIEFKLWNDKEDINRLVKNNYSKEIYDIYNSFQVHIMKIDFARLCILNLYPGIYSDMDVFCYKDFSDYLSGYSSHDTWLLEAPFSEAAPIENALMVNTGNSDFYEFCIQESINSYIDISKTSKITFPFTNINNRVIIANTAGPTLVYKSAVKYGLNKIKLLEGKLFNNHGMSYDPNFYTKHILTGMWGKEGINNLKKEYRNNNIGCKSFNEFIKNTYINDVKKYAYMENVTFDNFDLYKDYTNGQYIK
ncbi:MAG: glycosyltransferase [bacterium]